MKSADIQCYNAPIDSKRQELLMTHLLNIMAFPLQLKIRTMTAMTVTVLRNLKEPCGTWSVIAQTSMVTIIMGSTHRKLMESTGITGKVTITVRGKLR